MKKKSLSVQKTNLSSGDKNINFIYKKFEQKLDKKQTYAVAVSGGPDSLALSYLTQIYSKKYKTKFYYFLVDHKLRSDSSREAKSVKNMLRKINIKLKILSWNGKKPKSNIQSIARFNRYSLLAKECEKKKIKYILLGHHKDDRDENFFIRLTRGSGLKGLVSLNEKSNNFNLNLIRPLLSFQKKDLVKISKDIFKSFIEDPSNKNFDFKRIRMRYLIDNLEKEGLDKEKLNLTISNLKDSNNALDYFSNKNISHNSYFSFRRNTCILNKEFMSQPNEIVFRSIIMILKKVSKNYYSPRGKSAVQLINILKNGKFIKNMTLGGCLIKKVNETIIISRENRS